MLYDDPEERKVPGKTRQQIILGPEPYDGSFRYAAAETIYDSVQSARGSQGSSASRTGT